MSTLTIERQRYNIIERVMNINNSALLKQLDNYIKREEAIVAESEEEYCEQTKEELIAGLKQAFREAKLAKEGKLEGRPLEEVLNEL